MTTKNIKIALFGGVLMALILPFALMDIPASSTETVRDNSIKGKLFITDDNYKKQLTKADFEELERTAVKMTDSETKAMRANIDSVSENVKSLAESENIWITEIGTDHNTKSLKVSIERSGISEENHAAIEKKLREIVGNDVDITINYDDPLFFGCSQTGDCEPIEGGTRINVGGEICSMGYRATYPCALLINIMSVSGMSDMVCTGMCLSKASRAGTKGANRYPSETA